MVRYWYEHSFVKGINDKVLHQIIKCNFSGNGEHIGMTPVYSEWV